MLVPHLFHVLLHLCVHWAGLLFDAYHILWCSNYVCG